MRCHPSDVRTNGGLRGWRNRRLVVLAGCRRLLAAMPRQPSGSGTLLIYFGGDGLLPSLRQVRLDLRITMQRFAHGTCKGASCGWLLSTTPLFRVVRHGASLPEGRNSH